MPVRWWENARAYRWPCPEKGCKHVAKGVTIRKVTKALEKHRKEVHSAKGS